MKKYIAIITLLSLSFQSLAEISGVPTNLPDDSIMVGITSISTSLTSSGLPSVPFIPTGSGLPADKDIKWLIGKTICFRTDTSDSSTTDCFTIQRAQSTVASTVTENGLIVYGARDSVFVFKALSGEWSWDAKVISIE